MRLTRVVLTAILAATAISGVPGTLWAQPPASERPAKKLIEYGWDVPYPDQVRKDIRAMEKAPFDGIIFRLREWNHAFDPRPWDEAKLKPQLDDLAAIEWKTFTDNFLCLYAANNWQMDWFDDEQWNVWCYSERMNWWQNNVPDGAEAAIRSAREKIAKGQPLGFDIAEFIAAGRKKMAK
jgi:hypothetical protein